MAQTSPKTAPRTARTVRKPKEKTRSGSLPAPALAELATAFSQALDLAEGQKPGHAARVCYIAGGLAGALGLSDEEHRTIFYAALLHDAAAGIVSAELCRTLNLGEDALFRASPEKSPQYMALELAPANATAVVEALRAHPEQGAQLVKDLGCDEAVRQAVVAHHERWDGHGYPRALKGADIPITGRVVAAADLIEYLISMEMNPLTARRNLLEGLAEHTELTTDPQLADAACDLAGTDGFWLGLHSDSLQTELQEAQFETEADVEQSPAHLEAFARVFSLLADTRRERGARHSQRCVDIVDTLADVLGFTDGRREHLRVAALLHDVGLLGVPARVIAKPDILSLTEMEAMRKHPTFSQMVLEGIPGLESIAEWVGAHHERLDGKGYPEMLNEASLPVEARIIALADTYVALTSERPYRSALSHEDAQQVLLGGAGTQLDQRLVRVFCALEPESETKSKSSRTARRPRRKR